MVFTSKSHHILQAIKARENLVRQDFFFLSITTNKNLKIQILKTHLLLIYRRFNTPNYPLTWVFFLCYLIVMHKGHLGDLVFKIIEKKMKERCCFRCF
jgi:hypothetical protein